MISPKLLKRLRERSGSVFSLGWMVAGAIVGGVVGYLTATRTPLLAEHDPGRLVLNVLVIGVPTGALAGALIGSKGWRRGR
ncbi:hypothetical protein FJZ36_16880 [Candidatus Poribacteria bacterium]|nr:hypothetical protein [Candidatus Poribacteria bacterium]